CSCLSYAGRWGCTRNTRRIPVINIQTGYTARTHELVVKNVQGITTQRQVHALGKLEVLLQAQVHLVAVLGASHVAAHGAGERIATAQCIDRESAVYDKMNIRGIDQRAKRRCHDPRRGSRGGTDVDQLRPRYLQTRPVTRG